MLKKVYNNEYYYKILIMLFGILYWCWGIMPYVEIFFELLSILSLVFLAKIIFLDNTFFGKMSSICSLGILLAGICTILLNDFAKANLVALLYAIIEIFLLTYINPLKNKSDLQKEFDLIAKIFVFMSTIIIVISLILYFAKVEFAYNYPNATETTLYLGRSNTSALTGILANANIMSVFCVFALGFLLYLNARCTKVVYYFILVLDLLTLYLTYSRGGYIGAFIILSITGIFNIIYRIKYHSQKAIKFFLVLIIICGSLFCNAFFEKADSNNTTVSVSNRSQEEMKDSTATRLILWKAGVAVALDNPRNFFFGVGNQIREAVSQKSEEILDERLYNNMHNVYIQTLVSNGIIGALLLILLLVILMGVPTMVIIKVPRKNVEMFPILALIFALLVIGLVETDIYMKKAFEGTLIWILLGYYHNIIKMQDNKEIK